MEMSTNPRYFLSQLLGAQSAYLRKKKCEITIAKAYLTWDETEMYYLLKMHKAPGTLQDVPEYKLLMGSFYHSGRGRQVVART